jgi:anti-sigma regulatory factor (Ser/Thr protein kinase)
MEALLIDDWTRGLTLLPTLDAASVSLARERVRAEGRRIGLGEDAVGALAIVVSELANNQLSHGTRGQIAVRALMRSGVAGLEIVAADEGRGITNAVRSFEGASRAEGSLGVGLAGVRSLSDELDVDIRLGEGTCIRARKFGAPVARRREVAILGRPCKGERVSGDQAGFERTEGGLLLFVADGLGHGPEARDASDRALVAARRSSGVSSVDLLRAVDVALARSRGAVMAIANLDESRATVDFAAIGNVTTHIVRFRQARLFTGSSFVLGMPTPVTKRIASERISAEADEVIVMCSDGISSRATLEERRDMLHASSLAIAEHMLETFGQDNDDATVLVAR